MHRQSRRDVVYQFAIVEKITPGGRFRIRLLDSVQIKVTSEPDQIPVTTQFKPNCINKSDHTLLLKSDGSYANYYHYNFFKYDHDMEIISEHYYEYND